MQAAQEKFNSPMMAKLNTLCTMIWTFLAFILMLTGGIGSRWLDPALRYTQFVDTGTTPHTQVKDRMFSSFNSWSKFSCNKLWNMYTNNNTYMGCVGYWDDGNHVTADDPDANGFIWPNVRRQWVCNPEVPGGTWQLEGAGAPEYLKSSDGSTNSNWGWKYDQNDRDVAYMNCMNSHATHQFSISMTVLLLVATAVITGLQFKFPSKKKAVGLMVLAAMSFCMIQVTIIIDNNTFKEAYEMKDCRAMNESLYYTKLQPEDCAYGTSSICVAPKTGDQSSSGTRCAMSNFADPMKVQGGDGCSTLTSECTTGDRTMHTYSSPNANANSFQECNDCANYPGWCTGSGTTCTIGTTSGCTWSATAVAAVPATATPPTLATDAVAAQQCYSSTSQKGQSWWDCPSTSMDTLMWMREYGDPQTCFSKMFSGSIPSMGTNLGAKKYPECMEQNFEKCYVKVHRDTPASLKDKADCTYDHAAVKKCVCDTNAHGTSSQLYPFCSGKGICTLTDDDVDECDAALGTTTTSDWLKRYYLEKAMCGNMDTTTCESGTSSACYVNAAGSCVPAYKECGDDAKKIFDATMGKTMYENVPADCLTDIDGGNPSWLGVTFVMMVQVYVAGLFFAYLAIVCAACTSCQDPDARGGEKTPTSVETPNVAAGVSQ